MICKFNELIMNNKGKIYGSARNTNGLFQVDLIKKKVKYLTSFMCEKLVIDDLHSKVFEVENELIFLSVNDHSIVRYNYESGKQKVIPSNIIFVDYIIYNNDVYLIPYMLKEGIWKLDLKGNVIVKTNLLSSLNDNDDNENCDWYATALVDNMLFIVCYNLDKVYKIDLETEEIDTVILKDSHLDNIHYYDGWFYITDTKRSCVYKTRMNGNCEKIDIDEENLERGIYRAVDYKGAIIFLPFSSKKIYEYNPVDKSLKIICNDLKSKRVNNIHTKYGGVFKYNDKLFILPKGENKIVEYDGEQIEMFALTYNGLYDKISETMDYEHIIEESDVFGVMEFVNYISSSI